jgi:copper chaperone CopZ
MPTKNAMEKKEETTCCVTTCGLPLNANFWDNQYQNNETGWDLNGVSPPLKSFIDTLTDKAMRILIPGCGNAYEAEYLVQQGFTNVTLIDISSTLVQRLSDKFQGKPIRILHGDFFEHRETYDLILEQTFFCAINPSLRQRYAAKTFQLLNKGGRIAGLLFNVIFEKAGPPFGGQREDYVKLFEPLYTLKQFDTCTNSIKPRMGNELFIEMEKKDIVAECVALYTVSGITCTGCVNSVSSALSKVEGVTAVSVNTDFTEVLVVSSVPVSLENLSRALAFNSTYQLKTTTL